MKLTLGETLQNGRYILDAVLGQGGFGITYRATHLYLNQTVVIKTLNDSLHNPTEFARLKQHFIDEARCLARFQHPHIVRVNDFFRERELPFIVMDYIPGKTLAEVVQGPLPESQAVDYIRQVGDALSVIHQNGLLHRDIKPHNLILRADTQSVILIDFGVAREFTSNVTQTNTGLLSAGYAPIEQYLPQHRWTPATDVYALAATLYALLTGQPPVASVLRDRVPLPDLRQFQPQLSKAVEQAVYQGMALEPEQRPQSVTDWLALLSIATGPQARTLAETRTAATVQVYAPVKPGPSSAAKLPLTSGSTTVVATPKLRYPATAPAKTTPWHRSLAGALLATGIVAALIGAGFGLILRQDKRSSPNPTLSPTPSPSASTVAPAPPAELLDPELPDPEPPPDTFSDQYPPDSEPDPDSAASDFNPLAPVETEAPPAPQPTPAQTQPAPGSSPSPAAPLAPLPSFKLPAPHESAPQPGPVVPNPLSSP